MNVGTFTDASILEALDFKPQCIQFNNGIRCQSEAIVVVTYHEIYSPNFPCWNEGVYLCQECVNRCIDQIGKACFKCMKAIKQETDKLRNIVRL